MNDMANKQLPDDVEALKKMLLDALSSKSKLSLELEKKATLIGNLEETIRYLRHLKFGKSSEKFNDDQADLFNEVEVLSDEHDIAEESAENSASCGCQLIRSGAQRSEQPEVVPVQCDLTVHIRHTYACKRCEGQLKTAEKPAQPIDKSFASASLLAYIIVSKYLYALPIHRQEKTYESLKVPLKRNTMATWVINSAVLIEPLLKRFEYYLLREHYIQCDETRTQVLNEPNKRAEQISQMWVKRSMGDIPITLFNYTETRSGNEACKLRDGFSGYLQTDDYAGYNKAVKSNNIHHLGCHAHARRKFDEARKSQPKIKRRNKYTGAEMGLLF